MNITRRAILSTPLLAAGACGLGAILKPDDPGGGVCTSGNNVWNNYHLPKNGRHLAMGNLTDYKVDYDAWNVLDIPLSILPASEAGHPSMEIFVQEGGDKDSGWLGLASVKVNSAGHIARCDVTMNRVLLDKYTPEVAAHVLNQEIGHCLGLGHQRNANPPSCMDDCQGRPRGQWLTCLADPDGMGPNAHDAQELRDLYAHDDDVAPCNVVSATIVLHRFDIPEGEG